MKYEAQVQHLGFFICFTCGRTGRLTLGSYSLFYRRGISLAMYRDGGMVDGKRQWDYVVRQLPNADPNYQPATCQREGCTNPTPRHGQKYCSARCRVAASRTK